MPTAMKTIAGVGSCKEGPMEAGAGFHGPGEASMGLGNASLSRSCRREKILGSKIEYP